MAYPVENAGRYKANFTRGGLMVPESRVVSGLLLSCVDAKGWQQAITVDNVLAKRSPSTARTKATLIRSRLRTMPASIWELIRDGNRSVATHGVLAATVTYSPLFGDFLDLVVRDLYRRFESVLKPQRWDQYLADCKIRDPQIPTWSEATQQTLRTRVFGMMREAGYLAAEQSYHLQPLQIAPEVVQALCAAKQYAALRCIQLTDRDITA